MTLCGRKPILLFVKSKKIALLQKRGGAIFLIILENFLLKLINLMINGKDFGNFYRMIIYNSINNNSILCKKQ